MSLSLSYINCNIKLFYIRFRCLYLDVFQTLEAVSKYREVLLSAEEQKNKLKTDSLQRLHAMHNLWELLQTKPEGVAPTTRDDQLQPQVKGLMVLLVLICGIFLKSKVP